MALITLKARKDPIEISNDKAKSIKDSWAGVDVPKASTDAIVDLGWITFQFGQLKSIEITSERGAYHDEDFSRPLTERERKDRDAMIAKVRANLEAKGLLKPKIGGIEI